MKRLRTFHQKLHDVQQNFDNKPIHVEIPLGFCTNKRYVSSSIRCIFRNSWHFLQKKWQNAEKFEDKDKIVAFSKANESDWQHFIKNRMMFYKISAMNQFIWKFRLDFAATGATVPAAWGAFFATSDIFLHKMTKCCKILRQREKHSVFKS